MATGKLPFPWMMDQPETQRIDWHRHLATSFRSGVHGRERAPPYAATRRMEMLALAWSSFQRSRHSSVEKDQHPSGVQTFHVSTRLSPIHWPEKIISVHPPALSCIPVRQAGIRICLDRSNYPLASCAPQWPHVDAARPFHLYAL